MQRMQKALTEINLKLPTVLTDLTGPTGLAIVRGILTAERNPARRRLSLPRRAGGDRGRTDWQLSRRAPLRA